MDKVLKTYTVGAIVGLIGGGLIVGLPLSWKVDDQHKQLVNQNTMIVNQRKVIMALKSVPKACTGPGVRADIQR